MMRDRRKHFDPVRHETAPTRGNTKLVRLGSLEEECLRALGFEEIDRCEPEAVLLRAPLGFVVDVYGIGRMRA